MKKVQKVLTAVLLVLASTFLPLANTTKVFATTASADITIAPGAGTYTYRGAEENYDDFFADFHINGSDMYDGSGSINYETNDGDATVTFTFETLWQFRYYENITINGTDYPVARYLDFDDRTAWLNANRGSQTVSFDIPNVPKAANYDIVVRHGFNNDTIWFANFLWTADPSQAGSGDYIGHSKLEFVKAEYAVDNTDYTITEADTIGHMSNEGEFNVFHSADGYLSYGVLRDVNFDDGSLTLPGNCYITMRVVPEYGYQVTSVNGGANFTTDDAGVSEFTMFVPEGTNGYFHAEVTAVGDEVITSSDKVKSGMIILGDNELDAGTAQLYVEDITPDTDKITNFQNAASGYNISSYLDINLAQVFYKGTVDEVWADEIHHLENEATIALQLDEGVDGNEVVLVHNIDDGDEYEVIYPESFDPVTRVVIFKTKSFSGYAIATRTVASPSTGATNTTDHSSATPNFLVVSILASLWITAGIIYTRNRRRAE
ncbi:hypothetical protein IJG66_00990 [Candidatus Saccharibacteria bacterium]|nr:hypothetical protein [Candidatus Saccharibacteria bacterium]